MGRREEYSHLPLSPELFLFSSDAAKREGGFSKVCLDFCVNGAYSMISA